MLIKCDRSKTQQDSQCTYNITQARSRIIVAVEKQYEYYLLVCVCSRVRACMWARGRMLAHKCM